MSLMFRILHKNMLNFAQKKENLSTISILSYLYKMQRTIQDTNRHIQKLFKYLLFIIIKLVFRLDERNKMKLVTKIKHLAKELKLCKF